MESVVEQVETYSVSEKSRWIGIACVAGGVCVVCFALLGFAVSLLTRVGQFGLHAMTTVPMLFAVGLFATAWSSLRAPKTVTLNDKGLEITSTNGRVREIAWADVVLVKSEPQLMGEKRFILYGANGKALISLAQGFEKFDAMCASITRRVEANPSPLKAAVERGKARRSAAFLMCGGVLAWALAGVNFWMASVDQKNRELFDTQASPTTATIAELVIAPDGRTHRVHFKVDGVGADAPVVNVEVDPGLWRTLKTGTTVLVKAVPGRPDLAKLLVGQIDDDESPSPRKMYVLCAVVAVMGVVFFGGGVREWFKKPKA